MKKIINYSGIPVLVLIATLAFMPFSCSKEAVKENPLTDNSSQLIKISGEDAGTATKTTLDGLETSWNKGDLVGVYCPDAQLQEDLEGNGQENIPYTASSTALSSEFIGAMKWGATDPHVFYAYYPYNKYSEPWGEHWGVVPITLDAEQTQSGDNNNDHLSVLDFMVATPVTDVTPGTAEEATTVKLRYNHVFTILEFQIKGTGTLYAVSLTVPTNPIAFSGYTIDITQGTPASGDAYIIDNSGGSESNEVTVWLEDNEGNPNPATLSTTTATSVYMVINPGTQTDDCSIDLEIDLGADSPTWISIRKAAPEGGFLRGKKYVVPIDVVTDNDNNGYNTITIGDQTWMAENLKTTSYNDGTPIPYGSYEDAYFYYINNNGDTDYGATYGALYNWYAVNTGKLCPVGWHVPSDDEWTTLTAYLATHPGGSTNVAKALAAKTNWSTSAAAGAVGNDLTINNSSGFTALPGGGYRGSSGAFYDIGSYGYWWSSTEYNIDYAWTRLMSYYHSYASSLGSNKANGFSVRCIKD